MSAAEDHDSLIALRSLEERARELDLESQMSECIGLLQAPEVVIENLLRSVEQIRDATSVPARVELLKDECVEEGAFFYPSRELFVQGDGCSFTCLATDVDFCDSEGRTNTLAPAIGTGANGAANGSRGANGAPQPEAPEAPETAAATEADGQTEGEPEPEPLPAHIDYAAVTCEARPLPVLGFTQTSESDSAYPILLRALSSLIELTRPRRFDLLDREIYRGLLGPAPVFDLALVLWDDDEEPDPRRPLCELSRDLAEVLKSTLLAEPRFPPILNDVVCLRMNQKRFDGRLRYVWRV